MAGWSVASSVAGAAVAGVVIAALVAVVWPVPAPEVAPLSAGAPDTAPPAAAPVAGNDPVVAPQPDAAPAPVAGATPAIDTAAGDTALPAPEPAPKLAGPTIDLSRVAADGAAVVSGRADAGARVVVLIDGAPVAETVAGTDGSFAMLFTLAPTDAPSLMTVQSELPGGPVVASAGSVALAPVPGPVVAPVATAADAPAPAPAPPPVALRVTDAGATVAQAPNAQEAPPLVPEAAPIMVDAISYTPQGAVLLAGKGVPGQVARIYLDGVPAGDAPVDASGQWQVTLGDTAPGVYTLRVDQVDATGSVTARFETPFKRETQQALAALATPQARPAEPPLASPPQPARDPARVAAEVVAAPSPPPAPAPPPVSITVQPGFTLWGIARDSFGDGVMYVQVFDANRDKIRDPDLIYPGQVFTLPEAP